MLEGQQADNKFCAYNVHKETDALHFKQTWQKIILTNERGICTF